LIEKPSLNVVPPTPGGKNSNRLTDYEIEKPFLDKLFRYDDQLIFHYAGIVYFDCGLFAPRSEGLEDDHRATEAVVESE
jgi:hypothetical protein